MELTLVKGRQLMYEVIIAVAALITVLFNYFGTKRSVNISGDSVLREIRELREMLDSHLHDHMQASLRVVRRGM